MLASVGPFTLRPHQVRAVQQLRESIRRGNRRIILQAPCGFGKTLVSTAIFNALKPGHRGIFITSGRQLIFQKSWKMAECELPHSVLMANCQDSIDGRWGREYSIYNPEEWHRCLVVSKDTYQSRLEKGWMDEFQCDVAIVDEAHLGMSDRWWNILERLAKVTIGLTATPADGKGRGLGGPERYQDIVVGATYQELIDGGWLTPCKVFVPYTLSMKGVSVGANGEYVQTQSAERWNQDELIGDGVKTWLEHGNDEPTLVFAASVEHAIGLKERFNAMGVPAEHVEADTPQHERQDIYERFQSGNTKVITNYGVLRCLDEQTEILTDSGWKNHSEITPETRVANWENNGQIWFSEPIRVIKRMREPGERMVSVVGKRLNIRVTEDHDIIYNTSPQKNLWMKKRAKDLIGKQFQFPVSGNADPFDVSPEQEYPLTESQIRRRITSSAYAIRQREGLDRRKSRAEAERRLRRRMRMRFTVPTELSKHDCRFIGFWCGDGSRHRTQSGGESFSLSQSSTYSEIVDWIDDTIAGCGFSSTKETRTVKGVIAYQWRIPNGRSSGSIERDGLHRIQPYLEKDGSSLLWGLLESQFDEFVYGLHLADGEHGKSISHRGRYRISSTNIEFLSTVQAIAVCRNYEAKLTHGKTRNENHKPLHKLHLIKSKSKFFIGNDRLAAEEDWKEEMVWCVTTPSGSIITRRGGKVAVMGNCGVDFPIASCVQLLVSMNSLTTYMQTVGRGLRSYPGKEFCRIIDHGGNVIKHGWPTEDRLWTLDPGDVVKRVDRNTGEATDKPPTVSVCPKCKFEKGGQKKCPNCGWEYKRSGVMERTVDGKFSEITPSQVKKKRDVSDRQKLWMQCLGIAAAKNMSVAAARGMFRNRTGSYPDDCGPSAEPHQLRMKVASVWPGFKRSKS